MNLCLCAGAVTRIVLGASCVWLAKLLEERQGLGQGPFGEPGPFTSAHKMAAAAATVLTALFVGDKRPKSKTDSLLRGNAKPASELIKQLLCISEGAACLMSDTGRGILAALWPCRKRKKRKRKNSCACNLWCLSEFYSKQLWLIKP